MSAESEKLIKLAMDRSDFTKELFHGNDVDEILKDICKKINPKEDPINVLATMEPKDRTKIRDRLATQFYTQKCEAYRTCFREVSSYDNERDITVVTSSDGYLDPAEKVAFNVNIPIDEEKLYISDQYLHTVMQIEPLSDDQIAALTANPPPGIVAFDPSKIRYRFCHKPGIRLIQDINLYSDNTYAYGFTQNIMLYKDKREIPTRSRVMWNEMIGEDNGQQADVVSPDLNVMESRLFKLGAQTPKSIPAPLEMFIPLFFEYNLVENGFKLGTGTLRDNTLNYRGHLAPAYYMARAEYYDGVKHPVVLPTPRVHLDTFGLVGNYTYLSDYLHALNIYSPWARLLSAIHEERQVLNDMDNQQPIESQGAAQVVTAAVRPLSYETDFDLWVHFQRVSERCVQTPVIVQNPITGLPNTAAVQAVKVYSPWPMVKEIGMSHEDIILKPKLPTQLYDYVVQYKDGYKRKDRDAEPGAGLYEFYFNENYPSHTMSAVLNLGALRKTMIDFTFFDGQVDLENVLAEKIELITFVHYLDRIQSYGRTIGTTYIN